jgi:hypothetical protein
MRFFAHVPANSFRRFFRARNTGVSLWLLPRRSARYFWISAPHSLSKNSIRTPLNPGPITFSAPPGHSHPAPCVIRGGYTAFHPRTKIPFHYKLLRRRSRFTGGAPQSRGNNFVNCAVGSVKTDILAANSGRKRLMTRQRHVFTNLALITDKGTDPLIGCLFGRGMARAGGTLAFTIGQIGVKGAS